jgi:hypothetical protein
LQNIYIYNKNRSTITAGKTNKAAHNGGKKYTEMTDYGSHNVKDSTPTDIIIDRSIRSNGRKGFRLQNSTID